ncbi:MAG: hypothetical protein GX033_04850 [Firmicutes bacterium]|nr:hypothetical protein [Bacillota bacterium]
MSTWRGSDIAKSFGIQEDGMVLNGVFCFNTPFGLATPSIYRGDLDFLQWLGGELHHINTRLGRLSLSLLLRAPTGYYYGEVDGEKVLLATLETGPSCDPRNAFELFTVAVGLAHVHEQQVSVAGEGPDWLAYYQTQRDKLLQLKPPNLSKRALVAWANLEETWRLCVEESINLLTMLKGRPRKTCLVLGLQSFTDFVYLPDRHQVHYNLVANCHLDSPARDLAKLVAAAGGETRIANNMLLSYQRVREISREEWKEFFAHLWFPHEVELGIFSDPSVNPLRLQQASNLLQAKIGMISELEDLVLPPIYGVDEEEEKEALTVNKKEIEPTPIELEPVWEEAVNEATEPVADQPEVPEVESQAEAPTVDDQSPVPGEEGMEQEAEIEEPQEDVRINMTATTSQQPSVWRPFPPPLGAEKAKEEELEEHEENNVNPELE